MRHWDKNKENETIKKGLSIFIDGVEDEEVS